MDWYLIFLGLLFLAGTTSLLLARIRYGRPTLRWLRVTYPTVAAANAAVGIWFIYLGITA